MEQIQNQNQSHSATERQIGETTECKEYRRIQSWSTFTKKVGNPSGVQEMRI